SVLSDCREVGQALRDAGDVAVEIVDERLDLGIEGLEIGLHGAGSARRNDDRGRERHRTRAEGLVHGKIPLVGVEGDNATRARLGWRAAVARGKRNHCSGIKNPASPLTAMPVSAMCCQRPGSTLTWTPARRAARAAQVLASPRRAMTYLRMLMVLLSARDKKTRRWGRRV